MIIQHSTTLGNAKHYPHYTIGKRLRILNGTINIDKTAASTSSVARTSATVPIYLTSMIDSGTIKVVSCITLTVPIDLGNDTDTVKYIKIIPPINVRADPGHERLLEVIKELVTYPITMQTFSNPVRCTDDSHMKIKQSWHRYAQMITKGCTDKK